MSWDVSVASNGSNGTIDVEFGDALIQRFTLDYDQAEELRDMITDALEHLDGCERQKNPPEQSVSRVSAAYAAYLTKKWMTRRDDSEWNSLVHDFRRRRRVLDMTQQQVADSVGTCRSTLSLWETGRYRPHAPEFLRWAAVLGIVVTLTPEEDL